MTGYPKHPVDPDDLQQGRGCLVVIVLVVLAVEGLAFWWIIT